MSYVLGPKVLKNTFKGGEELIWSSIRRVHWSLQRPAWKLVGQKHNSEFQLPSRNLLRKKQGNLGISNQLVFGAHLSADPNGTFDDIQYDILTQFIWHWFSDLEQAAVPELGLSATSVEFIAWNGDGIVQSMVTEPCISDHCEVTFWRQYENMEIFKFSKERVFNNGGKTYQRSLCCYKMLLWVSVTQLLADWVYQGGSPFFAISVFRMFQIPFLTPLICENVATLERDINRPPGDPTRVTSEPLRPYPPLLSAYKGISEVSSDGQWGVTSRGFGIGQDDTTG